MKKNIEHILYWIKQRTIKTIEYLGKEAFLLILLFILLEVILAEFLFYQYIFMDDVKKTAEREKPLEFQQKNYESVLSEWQKREAVRATSPENYLDPFK